MSYKKIVKKLDRMTDSVTIEQEGVNYEGELDMRLSIWRELKNGNYEETEYLFKLDPESAMCAVRTMKRAVNDAVGKMKERIEFLEEEL